jgi:sulfonate transport system substrate-binding protein
MKIRIGGVPEHFNLPIHLAIENGDFAKKGIEIEWTTFKGGTGQMTRALRDDEVDVCVLLTEGIITDIIKGNLSKIISQYVTTPLIWGVHTAANNDLQHHSDIYAKKYAISRFGSGSHLMAIVDANTQKKVLDGSQFEVIKNLDGALESLSNLETDVFYWEKFTTKPYVDSGQLKRVGEFVTPWPCFVIAATDKILKNNTDIIKDMLSVIHQSCDDFMNNENAVELVSERYHQKIEDVARWYHSTEWATHGWVSNKMIKSVLFNIKTANIIEANQAIPELIWRRN